MSDYVTITADSALRFERLLPGPIERVWDFLVDSEKRGRWLASGPLDPRVGGAVELRFHHADLSHEKTAPPEFAKYQDGATQRGIVTRIDAPRLLSFTWGDGEDIETSSEVTFELTESSAGKVLLVVTHRRMKERSRRVLASSGWHAILGILEDQLHERAPRPFWTTFMKLKSDYESRLRDD